MRAKRLAEALEEARLAAGWAVVLARRSSKLSRLFGLQKREAAALPLSVTQ